MSKSIFMLFSVLPMRARTFCQGFLSDTAGVAAVEFALIVPVMITVWLGSVELNNSLKISRRVESIARTLSDLTSQVENVDAATLTAIVNTAEALMMPMNTSRLGYRLTSIGFFDNNQAKVCWTYKKSSVALSTNTPSRGDIITIMPNMFVGGRSTIMAEVEYNYRYVTSWIFRGTKTFKAQRFMSPRSEGGFVSFFTGFTNNGLPVDNSC